MKILISKKKYKKLKSNTKQIIKFLKAWDARHYTKFDNLSDDEYAVKILGLMYDHFIPRESVLSKDDCNVQFHAQLGKCE